MRAVGVTQSPSGDSIPPTALQPSPGATNNIFSALGSHWLPTTGTPPHTVRQVDQGPQNRPRQANHPEDIGDADVLTQYPTSQEATSHGRLPKACADGYHAPFVGPLLYLSLIHISEPTRLRRISY